MASTLPKLTYFNVPARAFACRVYMFKALGKDGCESAFPRALPASARPPQGSAAAARPSLPPSQALITLHWRADAGVDERIDFGAWGDLKPTTPLGFLPMLTLPSGLVINQSEAIMRWAFAKAGGALAPDDGLLSDEL